MSSTMENGNSKSARIAELENKVELYGKKIDALKDTYYEAGYGADYILEILVLIYD